MELLSNKKNLKLPIDVWLTGRWHLKKFIYLAHPYGTNGKTPAENMTSCTMLARRLARDNPDVIIFSPIHATGYMEEPHDRELGLSYCKEFLQSGMFDELWLAPGWEESEGCKWEKEIAEEVGMKVIELKGVIS